ncbi:MAG TPA: hypothetical protein PLB89_08435 [Flavobacteriales bacterium]|nr:hypothetical protein [Flavobacteriales bacterium]
MRTTLPLRPAHLLGTLLVTHIGLGQQLTAISSAKIGGIQTDMCTSVAMDAEGNFFVAGRFQGTADFDPGPDVYPLISAGGYDGFLLKLDPEQGFLWAKRFGGTGNDGVNAIALDGSANIVAVGYITGTVDMDPGPNELLISAGAFDDMCICKYTPDGTPLWAVASNSTEGNSGYALDLDASGNVYAGGVFYGTTDLNGGSGEDEHTSAGTGDAFLCKYSPAGSFVWGRTFGGPLREEISVVTVDPSGSVCIGGNYFGTTDLDPSASNAPYTSAGESDIFTSKFDASGGLLWANSIGGPNYDGVYDMDINAAGTIITTGYFTETVDFDPGPSNTPLTDPSGDQGMTYLRSMTSSGALQWAKGIGGPDGASGFAVEFMGDNAIALSGGFFGTIDADPGPGNVPLISNGQIDTFVALLSSSGDHQHSVRFGSILGDEVTAMTVAPDGTIHCTGGFKGNLDLNGAEPPSAIVAAGDFDGFLVALQVTEDVGVNELDDRMIVNAFPNPSNGDLTVELQTRGTAAYVILDALGRQVGSGQLYSGANRVDLSRISPGKYWLRTLGSTIGLDLSR